MIDHMSRGRLKRDQPTWSRKATVYGVGVGCDIAVNKKH